MTRFADAVESGSVSTVSALSSRGSVRITRVRRFTGGGNQSWSGVFPSNTQAIDMKLYIMANGSAGTSDKFVLYTSAAITGKALGTITGVGSATGVLRAPQGALGILNMVASASFQVGPAGYTEVETPFVITLSSVDEATDYGLELSYRRMMTPNI